jgi:hypothetical protein
LRKSQKVAVLLTDLLYGSLERVLGKRPRRVVRIHLKDLPCANLERLFIKEGLK